MLLLLLPLFICLLPDVPRCAEGGRRYTILNALEKATLFLENQYTEINIDAVLGYRILQAYMHGTLEKWNVEPRLNPEWDKVAHLEKKLSALILKAKRALEQNIPRYYQEFEPALSSGFWKVPRQWHQTDPSAAFSRTNGSCLDLRTSDFCISTLLGTQTVGAKSCLVPDDCRRLATKTHCAGYALSHQLFYFLFAEMKGCSDPLFLDAPYYKNTFCSAMMQSNLYWEKQALLHVFGDLFTENIVFCGLAGFSDFFKPQWLDYILSCQKQDNGGFWMYGNEASPLTLGAHARRVKRAEKILEDGSSSHNTAVAVGAIGGFLYYSPFWSEQL